MSNRGIVGAAVALLLVACALVAAGPLEAGAIGGLNTVSLSPGHGRAAAPFQVTYAVSPCLASVGLTITFSWGALAPAGQVLGTATTDSGCRATLSTMPPVNSTSHQPPAPGSYLVFGYVALPTGTPTPNTEASASYLVDVTPAPTATPHPSATAKSSATAKPSLSATNSSAASTTASAPAASGQPSAAASLPAGVVANSQPNAHPGWWGQAWQLGLGLAVLAFAILAAILLLIAWLLRRRRVREGLRNDRAA